MSPCLPGVQIPRVKKKIKGMLKVDLRIPFSEQINIFAQSQLNLWICILKKKKKSEASRAHGL